MKKQLERELKLADEMIKLVELSGQVDRPEIQRLAVEIANRYLAEPTTPSQEEIREYMELHNADEVGEGDQWDMEDSEYNLLLGDKYNKKTTF